MTKKDIQPGEEQHQPKNWLRDVILGGQDGLVNVLGIVLGVTAASGDVKIIIAASMAAAFAEAVSMGAVAYTSAIAEKDHYQKEWQREQFEVESMPEKEREEVRRIYEQKGFSGSLLNQIVKQVTSNKEIWVKTMMNEELQLQPIDPKTIFKSSLIVGFAALIGAAIPILPFFLLPQFLAVPTSLGLSTISLFAVGVYQAKTLVGSPWKTGMQMVAIGMGAAIVGFVIGEIFKVN